MDISRLLERDHAELHALGRAIRESNEDVDSGARDTQFDYLDLRARRHLAVIEDVLVHPLRRGEQAGAAADILQEHKALRGHLSALDRPDKSSAEWDAEFRHFADHLERVCHQHERLIEVAPDSGVELGRRYQEASLARIPGHMSANKLALGLGGAVALGAAAYAASRYFRSAKRGRGDQEDVAD